MYPHNLSYKNTSTARYIQYSIVYIESVVYEKKNNKEKDTEWNWMKWNVSNLAISLACVWPLPA